jgi:putative ATP-dependent endonuclease of OLD family
MGGTTPAANSLHAQSSERIDGCQLSYTSKWTLLARLMRKFHERLVADPDRVERLHASFDSVVAIFHEVEEFSQFGDELRRITAP